MSASTFSAARPAPALDAVPGAPQVAILINSFGAGGAERAMINLAGGLHAREIPVAVLAIRPAGPLRALVPPAIEVVDLHARRAVVAVPALARWLRRARPRVVLSACANSNVAAVLAARLADREVRTVVCEQTTLSRVARDTRRLRHRLVPVAARWAYPRADAVVAVSGGVAADLVTALGLSREDVVVIPNPLSPEIDLAAQDAPEHPWLRDGGPPVLVAVARLTPAKDLPTLVRAFAQLRATRPARLLVLGEGEERANLEALVRRLGCEADVDLAGFTANPYSAMAAAAALVLSSRREGLPTVLVEALWLGTPVVSTDCPSGPREILEGGRLGRLVRPGDHVGLAGALRAVLDDPTPPLAGRRELEAYTVDAVVTRYLATFRLVPAGA